MWTLHALHRRGWWITAIARHLGRDRKTIRAYLKDDRQAGVPRRADVDPFDRFEDYVRERLHEDPHVWATVLFDEIVSLGFERSYPIFTAHVRARGLRPHCEACAPARGRPVAVIEHPPGDETLCGKPHRTSTPGPKRRRPGQRSALRYTSTPAARATSRPGRFGTAGP